MKVCCLGSGSAGNAVLIEVEGTRVLVDAGFSARSLEGRLASVGLEPGSIDAILITHDHGDHTRGVGVFARRHGTPVYITERTLEACRNLFRGGEQTLPYEVARPFLLGGLRVEPFLTVHDAADPVGIALVDVSTGARIGIATDLGKPHGRSVPRAVRMRLPRPRGEPRRGYAPGRTVPLVGEGSHSVKPWASLESRSGPLRRSAPPSPSGWRAARSSLGRVQRT